MYLKIFGPFSKQCPIKVSVPWGSVPRGLAVLSTWITPHITGKKLSTNSPWDFEYIFETMNDYWVGPKENFYPESTATRWPCNYFSSLIYLVNHCLSVPTHDFFFKVQTLTSGSLSAPWDTRMLNTSFERSIFFLRYIIFKRLVAVLLRWFMRAQNPYLTSYYGFSVVWVAPVCKWIFLHQNTASLRE